jgi:hypothetical protein
MRGPVAALAVITTLASIYLIRESKAGG